MGYETRIAGMQDCINALGWTAKPLEEIKVDQRGTANALNNLFAMKPGRKYTGKKRRGRPRELVDADGGEEEIPFIPGARRGQSVFLCFIRLAVGCQQQ
jgi:hypothetical protein